MAEVICINCYVGYPVGYCLDDKPQGCVVTQQSVTLVPEWNVGEPENKDSELNDPISTGRKRAAKLFPISPGQVCEWAWRKQCGGGIVPVIGCPGRPATNIHHGPDKSTLNNDRETNISIICEFCHNRWHVGNDAYYREPRPKDNLVWLPDKGIESGETVHQLSEMVKATKQEVLMNEMMIPEGGKDKL